MERMSGFGSPKLKLTWRGYFSTRRYRGASLLCSWRVIRDPDSAIQTQISSLGIQLGHCCWGTIFLDGPRGNRFAAPDQLAIFQNTPVTLIHARVMKFRHL